MNECASCARLVAQFASQPLGKEEDKEHRRRCLFSPIMGRISEDRRSFEILDVSPCHSINHDRFVSYFICFILPQPMTACGKRFIVLTANQLITIVSFLFPPTPTTLDPTNHNVRKTRISSSRSNNQSIKIASTIVSIDLLPTTILSRPMTACGRECLWSSVGQTARLRFSLRGPTPPWCRCSGRTPQRSQLAYAYHP